MDEDTRDMTRDDINEEDQSQQTVGDASTEQVVEENNDVSAEQQDESIEEPSLSDEDVNFEDVAESGW